MELSDRGEFEDSLRAKSKALAFEVLIVVPERRTENLRIITKFITRGRNSNCVM